MNASELFKSGYAEAAMASDALQEIFVRCDPAPTAANIERIRKAQKHLRNASAAVTSLERLLAGNPEPKKGD